MKLDYEICKWKKHINDLIEQNPGLEEKIMEYKDRTMLIACYMCDGYNQECGSYEVEK